MLESILLGLALERELTGYEMKKRIEEGIGVFYRASYGSLYPALKRLAAKGCLSVRGEPQEGRQKIFYRTTEEGKRCFFEWLSSPVDVLEGANAHLVRVYFFDRLPPELRERKLLELEINHENYLQKLRAIADGFSRMEQTDCCYYKLSTLYYGIGVTEKTIEWCRHIRGRKPLREFVEGGEPV